MNASAPPPPASSSAVPAAPQGAFEALCGLVREGVLQIDAEGTTIAVNSVACALVGYDAHELIGRSYMMVAPPEIHPMAARFLMALLNGSERVPRLWRLRRKNGSYAHVRVASKPMTLPGGARSVLLVFDPSSNAEMSGDQAPDPSPAAPLSRELLQMVVDNVPAQIAYYDATTIRCVFANDAYARANGKTVQWAIGRHCRDIIGEPAWAVIESNVQRVIQGEIIAYERMLKLPDGHERRIEVNLIPHLGAEGRQVGVFVLIHDITRHYLAEQAVRESEERLRKFAAATTEAIVFHHDGVIEDCNEAFASAVAVPLDALAGRSLMEFVAPDMREVARDNIVNKREKTYQSKILTARGETIPFEVTIRHTNFQGRDLRLIVGRDVRERNALLDSLAQSRARYQQLVDNSHEAVIVIRAGVIMFANPTAERMFGTTEQPLVGSQSIDLVHPQDREKALARRRQLLDGERFQPYEIRMHAGAAAGVLGELWCQVYGVRIEWDDNDAVMLLLADVTEQHLLREKLSQALEQSEAILATTAVGVCMLEEGRYQWVNETYCHMLGHSRAELIGQSPRMHHETPQDSQEAGLATLVPIATTGHCSSEIELKRANGEKLWVQIDGQALGSDNGPRRAVLTCVDITQRKRAEAEMTMALAKERELGELKTRFVSMASHEFRTPLSTIQTSAELLRHYADRLPENERQAILRDIEQSTERMRLLMENFLAFGRINNKPISYRPVAVDLPPLVEQITGEIRSSDSHRHAFVLESPPAQEVPTLHLDPDLVRQIIGNLLSNACKYSPEGTQVRVRWDREADRLRLDVADQGIGIPAEDLPRLFETFHRASNVHNIQGTGLGLAILKRAVDAHHGEIDVSSELGQGSCFTVWLPWREVDDLA